jgi:hypothetical protein
MLAPEARRHGVAAVRGGRMRLGCLLLALGCLAIVTNAQAGSTRLGPSLAFPIPGRDVGTSQLGIDAGVVFEEMQTSHVGLGFEIAYHYWPVRSEYMAAYDRYLRGWFQTFDCSTWSFSAIQFTGHVKFVGPAFKRHAPWVQFGAGFYRMDRNFTGPSWDGSPVIVVRGGPKRIAVVPGGYCSVGVDLRASSWMVFGVSATYHVLEDETELSIWEDKIRIPGFSALTIGTHVLFEK